MTPSGRQAEPRLAINQYTTPSWSFEDDVAAYVAAGVTGVGVLRRKLAETGGAERGRARLADAGLVPTLVCTAGAFTTGGEAAVLDATVAIEETAALGAPRLVLLVGPATSSVAAAEACVAEALERLVPRALDAGIELAIEPVHPMFAAGWSYVCTLRQALALARRFDAGVGVILDSYHTWWDPELAAIVAEHASLIRAVHVSDWREPPRGPADREVPGAGPIDWPTFIETCESAGYRGTYEFEIISGAHAEDPAAVLDACVEAYHALVKPNLSVG